MLTYLEDYLEYIGGYRDQSGRVVNSYPMSSVRLANYDHGIVNSLSGQTISSVALTDRQHQLALKIVYKYRRQLSQQGISLPENLMLRMPIRIVDRNKAIEHDTGTSDFVVKFPYNQDLVEQIRTLVKDSCGRVEFDHDQKVWRIAATIPNLVWITHWAKKNEFNIKFDTEKVLEELYQEIQIPELNLSSDGQFEIKNQPSSIDIELLNQYKDNPLRLLIEASNYQIGVNHALLEKIKHSMQNPHWVDWSINKKIHIDPEEYSIDDFLDWIDITDQFPLAWHSNDPLLVQKLISRYGEGQVQILKTRKELKPKTKVVMLPVVGNSKSLLIKNEIAVFVTGQSIIYNLKKSWSIMSKKTVYWGSKILTGAQE